MSKLQSNLPIFAAAALTSCAPAYMYPIDDDIDDYQVNCQNKAPMGSHIAEVECKPVITDLGNADSRPTVGDMRKDAESQLPVRIEKEQQLPTPPEGNCGGAISD